MSTDLPTFPPLEALSEKGVSTLLEFHQALEDHYFQNCRDDGHYSRPEEWFVTKIEITRGRFGFNKSLEYEELLAYVARSRSLTGIKTENTNTQYCVAFYREDNPAPLDRRWRMSSTEELRRKSDGLFNMFDDPNRHYEMSTKFDRDFDKIVPNRLWPPSPYTPCAGTTSTSVASDPMNGTCSMKHTFTTNCTKSLHALADSVYSKSAPCPDRVLLVDPSDVPDWAACTIHLAGPLSLDTITTEPSEPVRPHSRSGNNVPRKHLYFYELVRLVALIRNRRACYRLFYERPFWLGGMIAHVLRLFLEIDISVRSKPFVWSASFDRDTEENDAGESDAGENGTGKSDTGENDAGESNSGENNAGENDYTTIGGKEDPGEDAMTKVFDSTDIRKGAWYSNTPRNATLRKVMMKWLEDKEDFENKVRYFRPPVL